jgi:hypothetical protein
VIRPETWQETDCNIDPANVYEISGLGGSFFLYLHNPSAKTELARGTFKFCKEYWYLIEEGKLEFKDWRKK